MHFFAAIRHVMFATATALVASAAFASPPAGTYKVDPVHSVAYFEIGHAGGISRFMGRFNDISGELLVDTPEKSKVTVTIKADSIDTKHEGLERHLRSPDFFSVVQYPTLSFKSTEVRQAADGTGTLTGDLTIRGVTRPMTFKLQYIGSGKGARGDTRVGYKAVTTIMRSAFGMTYGIPQAATDEVELHINIEAIRQ